MTTASTPLPNLASITAWIRDAVEAMTHAPSTLPDEGTGGLARTFDELRAVIPGVRRTTHTLSKSTDTVRLPLIWARQFHIAITSSEPRITGAQTSDGITQSIPFAVVRALTRGCLCSGENDSRVGTDLLVDF